MNKTGWVSDAAVVAEYPFRNVGTTPITIVSIQTSCSCTNATTAKHIYLAGEGGKVTATFNVGGQAGEQTKVITVIASDTPSKASMLTLTVNIKPFAVTEPKFLLWKPGEARIAKKVEITAVPSVVIASIEALKSDPLFESRLETLWLGHRYALWLKPRSTTKPSSSTITPVVTIEGKGQQILRVFAGVQ
jgi:hypothetical protein